MNHIVSQLAPLGRLRAAINLGNPVLAQRNANGSPLGVSVEIAREVANRLKLPLELIPFDGAGKVVDAATQNIWDIAFLAVDPKRADTIQFTHPYVQIEGAFVVKNASPYQKSLDLNVQNARIGVGKGAAYDLFLTRDYTNPSFARYPTSIAALEAVLSDNLDVGAGIRQAVESFAAKHKDLRVLNDSFMQIFQAVALPRGRGIAFEWVSDMLDDLITSGFIAKVLTETGQGDTTVGAARKK